MPADREAPTLIDYTVTALSPALIMALVGSLTFFLVEVCYAGQYTGRLLWTLFFFVFATVLIGRIAIEMNKGLATTYGVVLALATFVALVKFVEYPAGTGLAAWGGAVNLGLMAVIWWSANKLTWDCTFIDEHVDDSGKGLLEEVGMAVEEPEGPARPTKGIAGLAGWLERYDRYRAKQRKKPHTPGVWVVYFSLAALPIFGLGQALIPAGETGRRAYVFWLMTVYVGSGLGLLVTTSFLGLRRYLRQRNLQMPAALTGLWLGIGALLIVVFLLAGAFLPRPNAEYSLLPAWTPLGSKQREASRFALKRDGEGKGEGRPSSDPSNEDKADAKDGRGGQGQAGGKQSGRSGTGEKDGEKGNASGDGKGSGKDGSSGDQGKQDGAKSRNDQSRSNARGKADGQSSKNAESKDKSGSGSQQRNDQRSDDQKGSDSTPESYRPPDATALSQAVSWVATLLKWIVLGLLILVVIAVVLWVLLRYLGHFTLWARNLLAALEAWWNNLFGWGSRTVVKEEAEPVALVRRPKPFADFRNPFDDGSAAGQSPDDLVRYSFLALEAWAFERDLARRPDETPLEFANRLGREVPPLERDAERLTMLYARLAYARRRLPESSREAIQRFWTQLELTAEQPLPA